MIKQILGRLPRKPSKSADNREFGGSSASSLNASISSRKSDLASDRPINSNTIPFSDFDDASRLANRGGSKLPQLVISKLNDNSVTASFEALPAFRDVPGSEKQILFIKKLNLCCVVLCLTSLTQ
ncbi:hypothetical protein M0R45_010328 [Rubus argutus]|uniref:Uncharacterized protein n=1 Tax=Rubus argutus TaxID=59490 RepID=A0AAW1Y7F0_RUBAR